jgi:PAS domain S-box-containing protein
MPIRELLSTTNFFPEPMVLVSVDGTIDTSNQSFADQVGVSAEALRGKRLDTLAALSSAAIQEYLRACAQSKHVVQHSLLLRRRAQTIALNARGVAYPPQSAPSASQVLLRLIAESGADGAQFSTAAHATLPPHHWREIEDSLRRQSQILEVTLASIGDAVLVTDVDGHVTFLNSVAEALTGWSSEEAKARKLTEVFRIINERSRQVVEDPVTQVLQTGTIVGLANHTVLVSRDGREIPIDDSAAPIRLPNGELFGVVLIFRDITEERRADHARAWLAAIIESSEDAIVSKTLDGVITSWNPGAARLFGYAPEEIIGKPVTTIIPPELQYEEVDVLARLHRGERVQHFETVRLAKSGRRIDVSLTVSPIKDEHGQVVGASKIARDVSESKRSERLLREANQRKDEFLATLAHELRNPLSSVRNATELLCAAHHERADLQSVCEILDRQLRQMTRLVDDLLDVSRINAGRIELQPELLDVGALLRTIASSLRPDFDTAQQVLTLSMPPEPLYVQGDRIRLTQVFSNVLHNANKYTPDGGRIVIEARWQEADIVVSVRDTGVGIPPDMLHQVFELFSQVERSSHRTRGGLGIGLTLAKRLVEIQGGRIQAHSPGPGQGSEFVIRLPAREAPQTPVVPGAPVESGSSARRILVADDNEDAAVSLSMLLQWMGHETRVVTDGLAAVALAQEFQPDVVILDIGMPKLDGYEAARRIAEQPWAHSTLLVALTGWGQEADRARGQQAGFHRHLVKPVDSDTLRDVLGQVRPQS